jgi:hypothetical protein
LSARAVQKKAEHIEEHRAQDQRNREMRHSAVEARPEKRVHY